MQDDKTVLGQYQATLPVALTATEETVHLRRLAKLKGELEELELATRRAQVESRRKKKTLEDELTRVASIARAGAEPRRVTVFVVADFSTGTAEHLRADTNERLEGKSRPLRPEERQSRLFEDAPPTVGVCSWAEEPTNPFGILP